MGASHSNSRGPQDSERNAQQTRTFGRQSSPASRLGPSSDDYSDRSSARISSVSLAPSLQRRDSGSSFGSAITIEANESFVNKPLVADTRQSISNPIRQAMRQSRAETGNPPSRSLRGQQSPFRGGAVGDISSSNVARSGTPSRSAPNWKY